MSSPLKLATSLLLPKRIVSPVSPKFLSPNYKENNPRKFIPQNIKQNVSFLQNYAKNGINNVQIKLTVEPQCVEDNLLINSPNKLDLLKHGLNKHDLLYAIGRGTFGTVIRGNYKGKVIAAKIIRLDKPLDKLNEYNALCFDHENIIKTIDIIGNCTEKYALILMEYYKNSKNLQCILDDINFPLSKETIVKFSKDIVKGVSYCHQNSILHLDIKPKNILLCDNVCKICDFGNSVKESEGFLHKYRGTVAYTAPEILKGEIPTFKSDVYSLGILFWQMITKKFPYESMDNEVIIYKVVKFNLRPSIEEIKNMEEFIKICLTCWEEKPVDRPPTSEILVMLHNM